MDYDNCHDNDKENDKNSSWGIQLLIPHGNKDCSNNINDNNSESNENNEKLIIIITAVQ